MAERRPLVMIDGRLQELPDGDTIAGASGGSSGITGGHPGFVSGRYYTAPGHGRNLTSATYYTGYIWIIPIYIKSHVNITKLGIYAYTNAGADRFAKLAIYTNENGLPKDLVVEATVQVNVVGDKIATIDEDLQEGWYWLAMQVSSPSAQLLAGDPAGDIVDYIGRPSSNSSYYASKLYASHTYGSFPDPAPTSWTHYNDASPLIWIGI